MLENILIVGANRGIGLGLIKEILNKNSTANIFATYRDKNKSTELINLSKKHQNLKLLTLEISNQDSINNLKNVLKDVQIDYLIINSGILIDINSSIESVKEYELKETFSKNTVGPIMVLQSLLENVLFSNKKVVMVMSSISGSIGSYKTSSGYGYRMSKAALNASMRLASIELLSEGVKILMMHPGWVKTDMGGKNAQIEIHESVKGIISVLEDSDHYDTGSFIDYMGEKLPW